MWHVPMNHLQHLLRQSGLCHLLLCHLLKVTTTVGEPRSELVTRSSLDTKTAIMLQRAAYAYAWDGSACTLT
jgi:hypothetical protein